MASTLPTLSDSRAAVADRVIAAMAGPEARAARRPDGRRVAALCEPAARVLVVQATGWGKSAVYWAATAIRRSEGAGPTLVVSPLLSLMRDQVAAAARAGPARGDAQLLQHRRVDGDRGSAAGGRRSTCCSSRRSGWPTPVRPPGARRAGRPARTAGDRRGARGLRLGARLPARLPPGLRRAAAAATRAPRCSRRRRPPTHGSPTTSPPSWRERRWCCAARWRAPASSCRWSTG